MIYRPRSLRRTFAVLFITILGAFQGLYAQIITGEGPRYPGTTGEPVPLDTAALKEARERALESAGLLERPIDPNTYRIGPNDIVTISIFTSIPKQFDVIVTPDARIVIPGVGDVDVAGRTLNEARARVRETASRVFRTDVSLSLKRMRQFKVYLIGAVKSSGTVAASPGTRVSEVIEVGGGVSPIAEKRYVDIFRNGQRIPVDLLPFYSYGNLEANPFVEDGDVVKVGVQDPANVVRIYGAVQREGEFAYRAGDSISSLIRYASGFTADALLDSIELVSVNLHGDTIQRSFYQALPDGSIAGDYVLRPGDRVFVRSVPNYRNVNRAVTKGEVRYPGSYAIEPGVTTLLDMVRRSGGFTEEASISDAVLIRRKIALQPDPEFDRIWQLKQIDPEKLTPDEVEYFRVKSRERPGVMTINFQRLLNGDPSENITLMDEDSLFVPLKSTSVKVGGKVKNPGSLTFYSNWTYLDYIRVAGGFGWRADQSEARIIKGRTGETFLASNEEDYVLEPGDAIFVPEEPPSDFWKGFTNVITVVAQLATIVAVIISVAK